MAVAAKKSRAAGRRAAGGASSSKPEVKKSSKAKAKGQAKQQSKQKTKAKQEVTSSSDEASQQEGTSRRLDRRDTDEQARRAVKHKLLGEYSLEAINGCVNAKGEHVKAYIARHVRANKKQKKYLSSRFWVKFFKEFDLVGHSRLELPEPEEGEEIEEAMFRPALEAAHSGNPAARTVEPMERLLAVMRHPSYTMYFGLIMASQESPTMSRQKSLRFKVALLGRVARFFGYAYKHNPTLPMDCDRLRLLFGFGPGDSVDSFLMFVLAFGFAMMQNCPVLEIVCSIMGRLWSLVVGHRVQSSCSFSVSSASSSSRYTRIAIPARPTARLRKRQKRAQSTRSSIPGVVPKVCSGCRCLD